MKVDKIALKDEVEQLRLKGYQFEKGEITRNEFKAVSGGMGSYAQKENGRYMIRLKTPSGVISKEMLALIIGYCDRYKIDTLHLTTRQAVQLHDLSIDEVCDIMADGIDHDLFTRGGGGNFPRNVALSPLAGVDREEAFDVTPYALLAGEYFQERTVSYHLPRKFKAAFSSAEASDTACAAVNDIGFIPVLKAGEPYFKMYLAGGIGGHPGVAYPYEEEIDPRKVLYYIEAMVRMFVEEGDFKNKAKARTRFIPRRMGIEAFMTCYKDHVRAVMEIEKLEEISPLVENYIPWESEMIEYPMVTAQKQKDRYTVAVHPLCGQLKCSDAKKILDFLEQVPAAGLRSTMNEDLYIRNLTWEEAAACIQTVSGFNQVHQIGKTVTCIGTPSCQQGVVKSQALCMAICEAVRTTSADPDILPAIHISGCPSSCARHPVSPIGFVGRRAKRGAEIIDCFELHLNGSVGSGARLGEICGTIPADIIPAFIVELRRLGESTGESFEKLIKQPEFGELLKKYCI